VNIKIVQFDQKNLGSNKKATYCTAYITDMFHV